MINEDVRNMAIVDQTVIDKVIGVIRREWEDLRHNFRMCGDIGEFNFKDFSTSGWLCDEQQYEWFVSKVIGMNEKFSRYGNSTPEALDVVRVLAQRAAEKLGLRVELASAFAKSYACVRTGLIAHYKLGPKQILFYKMYFPFGVWFDQYFFDPSLTGIKLKAIFEMFRSWQNNPQTYEQDFAWFKSTEKAWKEWEEVNE
jgi:hypothetical protein